MLDIKSLNGNSVHEITKAFNDSFADYYLPILYTSEMFQKKINSENGIFELSVGTYDGDDIVGFIMHYFDEVDGKRIIYNGGTGVIPSHRGQGLTSKMYDYILPILKSEGIQTMVLEVLTVNAPAIRVYEKVGFHRIRTLDCYKGILTLIEKASYYEIRALQDYDWKKLQTFWDYPPTWQNSILTLSNLKTTNVSLGIYHDNSLLGYIIYNPSGNKINQLAIHKDYRRKGLGRQLVNEVALMANGIPVSMINVDYRLSAMEALLNCCGMEKTIQQYEMEMSII